MSNKNVKDGHNELIWKNLDRFTKPNGRIGVSDRDGRLAFIPRHLPPAITYDRETVTLLAKAERKVGELKGRGSELENPHILISPYLKKEAVLSSRIEGTLASLKDLNRQEVAGSINRREAETLRLREVVNYVLALEDSLRAVRHSEQRVSLEILKAAHKKLMDGVRGQDKEPGKIRNRQNWITKTLGASQEIVYTPPPPEEVPGLLKNLEEFLQTDREDQSVLIQCAIIHYQFEAIHPFLDGNGRIGRLLLPLVLCEKGILPEPLLYLSAYFDRHREQYYNGLLRVSQKSRWREWIKFFLRAFIEQADEATDDIQRLMKLMKKYKEILRKRNASGNAIFLMERLFANPYTTIPHAAKFLGTTYPAAKNAVTALVEAGILKQANIRSKSKVFIASEIEDAIASGQ